MDGSIENSGGGNTEHERKIKRIKNIANEVLSRENEREMQKTYVKLKQLTKDEGEIRHEERRRRKSRR